MPPESSDSQQSDHLQLSLRVLLVSKDTLFARIARAKLEGWGHTVCIEEDLAAAIQWYRIDPFHMVIVDFDLPDGGGERLCRDLRGIPRPDYLYLLGYGGAADKERSIQVLEAGADSYSVKPLHPAELRLRLEQAARLLSANKALLREHGTDPLTGLLGRQTFERVFAVLHAECLRSGSTGSLMFVDVVNTHELRRRFGPPALDAVDADVARRLARVPRASDIVTRLDQGRFCLLLTNTSSLQSHVVALRIGEALKDLHTVVEGGSISPRMTVSVTDFPVPAASPAQLLERLPSPPLTVIGPESPLEDDTIVPTSIL